MQLDASQVEAVRAAVAPGGGRVRIVTGPAGTGKTTVIRAISDALLRRCTILAPTGKAAARIREACGLPAATVHRELLYDGTTFHRRGAFEHTVIVDEASMMDSALLAALLRFKPPRLVLVGDVDQLPPVGSGQPFHDLVAAGVGVSRLTVNHRSKEAVHEAAELVRAGCMPPVRAVSEQERWAMVESGPAERTTATLLGWVERGQFDPERDVVLSPRYGEEQSDDGGIDALNKAIRQMVNPPVSGAKFQPGDRVLCCKNFGPDDLWNGDTGSVVELSADDEPVVRLDRDPGDPRKLTPEQVRECRLGYAMSIHKAQGSQFRRVFVVCLWNHRRMLSRPLLYTAITRAREACCVVGQLPAFRHGLGVVSRKQTVLQVLLGGERSVAVAAAGLAEIGL